VSLHFLTVATVKKCQDPRLTGDPCTLGATLRRSRRGGDEGGDAGGDGYGENEADRGDERAHDLLGELLGGEQVEQGAVVDAQQHQQDQRGADVGEDDRVDRRGDVV